jgi:hypothetical protein
MQVNGILETALYVTDPAGETGNGFEPRRRSHHIGFRVVAVRQ